MAKPFGGAGIELAFGRDPFAAAGPARVRLTLREVEQQRRALDLDVLARCGRSALRACVRSCGKQADRRSRDE
jgi:hypothetical protein